ncbi:MAG: MGMT family protein [Gammaproteobacteria bacterium]|nr:MGMT family protein [Gammaproteobacteria bacterium]MDA7971510.1 MGMT family protein [Gammaproteobacteria bacterium]
MATYEEIRDEVKKIDRGEVRTYGQVAKKVKTSPQAVGGAMRDAYAKEQPGKKSSTPWWRVLKKVNDRYARISPKAPPKTQKKQRERLIDDGITFVSKDRVEYDAC